jgi:hypothetical protein
MEHHMPLEGYLSEPELAEKLGKSRHALERWRRLRIGPNPTFIGKTPHYRAEAVEAWLLAQERAPVRGPKRRRRAAAVEQAGA